MKHLWEVKHPYYCAEGCYYVGGYSYPEVHSEFESFKDFLAEWKDADVDYNLLFRFDWVEAGPDYELEQDQLRLYFFMQRKARPHSIHVTVTKADEPAVIEYLKPLFAHMLELWEPLESCK